MVSIKLAKPWLEHAIGDTVEVDPLRAQWLRENGYEDEGREIPSNKMEALVRATDELLQDDKVPPGHIVSRGVRKALVSKLCEPLSDLEVHPPVVDLLTPNQDPPKD